MNSDMEAPTARAPARVPARRSGPGRARQVVRWAKYPPRGDRGLFQANYEAGFGTVDAARHVEQSNLGRWLAVQIETPDAVECVEDIAAVDGVDVLFIGTSDLTAELGISGQMGHPKVIAAYQAVGDACKKHGKHWGIVPVDPAYADRAYDLGCRMITFGNDIFALKTGIASIKNSYKSRFG